MQKLLVKSIDVMKKTKDAAVNQLSDAEILDLVTCLKKAGATHVAISMPMDRNSDFIANGNTPSPRTSWAHAQKWADTIHSQNMGMYFRGTFCGAELDSSGLSGLFSFPLNNYNAFTDSGHVQHSFSANPVAQGTAASAATDGWNTWLGRIYTYITSNPTMFKSGDIWSPMPEQDNFLFNGQGGGTPSTFVNANIQTNITQFYTDLKTVSDAAFATIPVTGVDTSHYSWNYSTYYSQYLSIGYVQATGSTTVDYYGGYNGSYTPSSYITDMNNLYTLESQPIMWGEWGYIRPMPYGTDEGYYLMNWLKNMTVLVNAGKITRFNYWGGWDGQNTSILYKDVNGKYQLNGLGKMLAAAYSGTSLPRVPVFDANGNY